MHACGRSMLDPRRVRGNERRHSTSGPGILDDAVGDDETVAQGVGAAGEFEGGCVLCASRVGSVSDARERGGDDARDGWDAEDGR